MRSLFLKDEQAGLLTVKDKILYVLVVMFLISFYPDHMVVVNNVVLALLSAYCFFIYNSFREKLYLLRKRKEVAVMIAFYLLHIISSFLSNDVAEGFSWVVIRMPLFVFPVSMGLVFIKQELKERILYAYSVITTIMLLIGMVLSVIQSIRLKDVTLLYNDNITIFMDKQSVYIALLVNVAVFCFGYLLSIKSSLVSKKGWVYACIFVLLVANFLLASRISIISLYSCILLVAIGRAIQKKKTRQLVIIVAAIVVGLVLLENFFPKTVNRFKELKYTSYKYTDMGTEAHFNMSTSDYQWNGANIRLAVWSCGWEVVKKYPVFGAQLGDKVAEQMKVYKAKHFEFAYKSHRNMHNNYLDIWAAFGTVGLLIFLYGFLFEPIRQSIKTKDILGLLIIGSFMLAFLTETYFDRSMGNFIFAFFITLIVSYRKPEGEIN